MNWFRRTKQESPSSVVSASAKSSVLSLAPSRRPDRVSGDHTSLHNFPVKDIEDHLNNAEEHPADQLSETSTEVDSKPPLSIQPGNSYSNYADVPRFQRVLTGGDRPLYSLQASDVKNLVVIELPGRKCLIIASPEVRNNHVLLESVRGAFIAANYSGLQVYTAPTSVIAEVYAAAVTNELGSSSGRSTNVYMGAVHQWLEYAVKNRATDIHIETRGTVGKVRLRVDGEVEEMRTDDRGTYPSTFVEKCMGALFNNEQQRKSGSGSLFEASSNLYCMVPYAEIPGHTLKLRYQSLKGSEGPKTVLRLLPVNENAKTLTFEELGYETTQNDLWRMAMNTPSGAVLIAGVTGSGKSTTQKSFLELNPNAPTSAIYTVEDPVEYPIRFTHQIAIQRDLSDPSGSARIYSETISALVRADPDIVMLGEIRDRYSASAAQQMTETGHMALGTVHAHLLSGIVPRLVNPEIGMNREVLTGPNMLTLLVYQALVPRLCQHCAHPTDEAEEIFPDVADVVEQVRLLNLDPSTFRWKRPGGCSHCGHRGSVGQTVVAEMLMPDEEWLRPIRESRDADAVEVYRSQSDKDLTSSDMAGKTVFEHTLLKAIRGHVDARQCSRFDNFARFVKRYKKLK